MMKKFVTRKTDIPPLTAACLFLACRVSGFPRSYQEVAVAGEVEVSELSRMQALVAPKLGVDLQRARSESFVGKIVQQQCMDLSVGQLVSEFAKQTCVAVDTHQLLDGNPQSIAAACVLLTLAGFVAGRVAAPVFGKESVVLSASSVNVPALIASAGSTVAYLRKQYSTLVPYATLILPAPLFTRCEINGGGGVSAKSSSGASSSGAGGSSRQAVCVSILPFDSFGAPKSRGDARKSAGCSTTAAARTASSVTASSDETGVIPIFGIEKERKKTNRGHLSNSKSVGLSEPCRWASVFAADRR